MGAGDRGHYSVEAWTWWLKSSSSGRMSSGGDTKLKVERTNHSFPLIYGNSNWTLMSSVASREFLGDEGAKSVVGVTYIKDGQSYSVKLAMCKQMIVSHVVPPVSILKYSLCEPSGVFWWWCCRAGACVPLSPDGPHYGRLCKLN